jgi:hypothetical protein
MFKTERAEVEALRKINHNEQYSTKYNFKIMGLTEKNKENTWEVIKSFVKENAGVELQNAEIVAAHRIPWEKGKSRPILVKLANTYVSEEKGCCNRQRLPASGRRNQGQRQTYQTLKLSELEEVQSAWYFNDCFRENW